MPSNASHDHHFVPVFYLKRWIVPPEKKLVEYARRKHGPITPRWTGPKGTGYEPFGYDSRDGSVASLESTFFEPTDTQAAVAMERFFTHGEVTEWRLKPRQAWTNFLLTMLMRHPEDLVTFRRMLDADWVNLNDEMREAYFRDRTPEQPETAEEFWEQSRDAYFEEATFRMLRKLMRNSKIANIIDKMDWTTLVLHGAKHPLLTSDRPVLTHGGKLNEPGAFIMMPLGPRRLFLATRREAMLQTILRIPASELVNEVNQEVVGRAERFVFASDTTQTRFVQNRFGRRKARTLFDELEDVRAADRARAT